MKNFDWKKKVIPHVIVIAVFLVVALVYCSPALQGKVLQQHDVMGWKGMAQNSFEYKEKHGNFPLWTNGMFSGMPTYQIAMEGKNPIPVGFIENILTLFLPKPANFFFLACICFYILSQVLRTRPVVGLMGALAYAYATYNPIIVAVGHDTKMHAIALLPAFVAAIILVYEKKYLIGAALTALFSALLISANHLQITYYGLIIVAFMTLGYMIAWIKQKQFKHLFTAGAITLVAGLIGVTYSAVTLFTTYEYAKESIRGGSALATDKTSFTKTGLSTDYALSYSMGIAEPMVMMFPKMFGGSSAQMEISEEKSKTVESLQNMPQELAQQLQGAMSFYWGGIDGVGTSGPPYAGAVICFLALLGFGMVENKHKWWILGAAVFTILLSWGKYLEGFNVFMLKYLPMYNKFRAPSMIIVAPTLLAGIMAVLTVEKVLATDNKTELWNQFKRGLIVPAAFVAIAFAIYLSADFKGESDKQLLSQIESIQDPQQKAAISEPVKAFVTALRQDRQTLMLDTILRSLFFMAAAAALLWAVIKNKINALVAGAGICLLSFVDIMVVNNTYLNQNNYVENSDYEAYFSPSAADNEILKDKSYFRIFDITQGVGSAFNGNSLSSYFHKSIGGYHPAKLSIYQDLIEKQLYNFPNCMPVINMLNTKYIINLDQQRNKIAIPNPDAAGPVWFVKTVKWVNTPEEEMNALTTFNPKDTAVISNEFKSFITPFNFDSTASIRLINNDNDVVTYESNAASDQLAVFSEVFYKHGWKAYIDDKESSIVKVNYVLRGLMVPAGKHNIRFEFKPQSYYTGDALSIAASVVIWLLLLGAAFFLYRQSKTKLADKNG